MNDFSEKAIEVVEKKTKEQAIRDHANRERRKKKRKASKLRGRK